MKLKPGSTFADRYEIQAVLGEGGMGIVYKALDTNLDIIVALKVLLEGLKDETLVRFQREAKLSGQLDHPNIAKTFDFASTESGTSYLVMQFIQGVTLSDFIEKSHLEVDDYLTIFEQICSAMAHAHSKGIIHRDLKPGNVIVSETEDGINLSIVDFGIAKQLDEQSITQTGVAIGSPPYVSPEQVRGVDVDHRTDIYSFGCLMFKLLTGDPPFKGETILETLNFHISEPAPKLSEQTEETFPSEFESIIERCLKKEADNRPQSFDELLNEFETIADPEDDREIEDSQELDKDDTAQSTAAQDKKSNIWVIGTICIILLVLPLSLYAFGIFGSNDGSKKSDSILPTTSAPRHRINISSLDKDKCEASNIRDEHIEELKQKIMKNPEVHRLHINLGVLSGVGLNKLANIKKLDTIKFRNTKISGRGFEVLSQMPQLTDLEFYNTPISAQDIEKLQSLPDLQYFKLHRLKLDEDILKAVAKLPKIMKLDIRDCDDITPDGILSLSKSTNLCNLIIDGSYTTKEFQSVYPKLTTLVELEFEPINKDLSDICKNLEAKMPNCHVKLSKMPTKSETQLMEMLHR